jgi:tetratricopeptide (TPR) repeat protein
LDHNYYQGFSVKPKKGMGLFFGSLDQHGNCNPMTKHVGAQVTKGEKWVLQRWYHEDWMIPGGGHDNVLCDTGNNCRHYMYNQNRAKCKELGKEGELLKDAGNTKDAIKKLQEALSYWPSDPMANAHLGEILMTQGKAGEAIKHLKAAVRVARKFPAVHFMIGEVSLKNKDFEEASASFKALVAATPDDTDGWYMLAQSLQGTGKYVEALEAIQTHLKVNRRDVRFRSPHAKGSQLKTQLEAHVGAP